MPSDAPPPPYSRDSDSTLRSPFIEIHHGLRCDGCSQSPIAGTIFKCKDCADFDICSTCCDNLPPTFQHPRNHTFLRLRMTGEEGVIDSDIVHLQITCDGCNQSPIRGKRYHCKSCEDFDLCQSCVAQPPSTHSSQHRYICLSTPAMWTYHAGHHCDGCGLYPIVGPRYRCVNDTCRTEKGFDLCSDYMDLGIHHPTTHPMLRLQGQAPS
ncbi:E3 ubiquitin-protein ligase mib1 [Marasmius tenuissimus]|nr:E3 ubiquitin-protein ligase mib1 [Marasmius tenuissimus]